ISRTHVLQTGLAPGKWHEFDERLLHGMFNEFVDFVEIEAAWNASLAWEKSATKRYGIPWYHKLPLLSWGSWRCPQAGVDHFKWAQTLHWAASEVGNEHPLCGERTAQALAADEVL